MSERIGLYSASRLIERASAAAKVGDADGVARALDRLEAMREPLSDHLDAYGIEAAQSIHVVDAVIDLLYNVVFTMNSKGENRE